MKTRVGVIILFVAVSIFSAVGVSKLKIAFDQKDFIPADHEIQDALKIQEVFFDNIGMPLTIYLDTTMLYKLENQKMLNTLATNLESCPGCIK
jgi:predicted RND superfamily exporter protein